MGFYKQQKRFRHTAKRIRSLSVAIAFGVGMAGGVACPKNIPKTQTPKVPETESTDMVERPVPASPEENDQFVGLEKIYLEDFAAVPLGKLPENWSGGDRDMVKVVGGKKRLESAGRGYHTFYLPLPDLPDTFVFVLDFAYIQGGVTFQFGNLSLERRRFYDELHLQNQKGVIETGVLMKPFTWTIEKQGDTFTTKINGKVIASTEIPDFSPGTELVLDFGQEDYSLGGIRILGKGEIMSSAEMELAQPNEAQEDTGSEGVVMDFIGNE